MVGVNVQLPVLAVTQALPPLPVALEYVTKA
jgi:hypothetical protein